MKTRAHLCLFFLPPYSSKQDPTAAAVAASDAAAKLASSSSSSSSTTTAPADGGPSSLAGDLKARHASLRASRAAAAPDATEVLDAVANAMVAAAAAAGAR